MTELVEWLTKVLDEDEARISAPEFCSSPWPSAAEMLADIAAKREIVAAELDRVGGQREFISPEIAAKVRGRADSRVLRALATAYAERGGYDYDRWRP